MRYHVLDDARGHTSWRPGLILSDFEGVVKGQVVVITKFLRLSHIKWCAACGRIVDVYRLGRFSIEVHEKRHYGPSRT